jgi:uncharacterized C2H2 Zn-finger protein
MGTQRKHIGRMLRCRACGRLVRETKRLDHMRTFHGWNREQDKVPPLDRDYEIIGPQRADH